jgi:hypothetical protein
MEADEELDVDEGDGGGRVGWETQQSGEGCGDRNRDGTKRPDGIF